LTNSVLASRKGYPGLDISQLISPPHNQLNWFTFLGLYNIKVAGETIVFDFDLLDKNRAKFITELKEKAKALQVGKIKNQKRWYKILRGIYILKTGSYSVTPRQKKELNTLHDLSTGWEKIRDKTIKLLSEL
jgi:hypothetical protein